MLSRVYKVFQALSLDVVCGGAILSYAIGLHFGVSISIETLCALGLTIWLIYTFDHLLDTESAAINFTTFRHQFHREYRRILIYASIAALMVGCIMTYYLSAPIVRAGVYTGILVIIYFVLIRWTRFWVKEVFVALGYTAGVFLAPIALAPDPLSHSEQILIVQVFLLALQNLLIFSVFDFDEDINTKSYSVVTKLGKCRSAELISVLLVASLVLVFVNMARFESGMGMLMQTVLALMNLTLFMLHVRPDRFQSMERFRVLGDGIFYLPLIYLLYA